MRIRSMTATFGKLEQQTLTLEPGLNIVHAPNEWGKSTWCAFLVAMLYGIETRAKSTKTVLADKDRYAPWSGSPMSGRMEIEWEGRNITIERSTKGRVPLGKFQAYETESGLPVAELTADNCGQMLLGIERSVFLRSGFIRLSDLPVTQDDALRRRLNALVTTGDESGDGERLARGLKDLKNRCRYNRTGLLPQAEAERAALEEKLRALETLEDQESKLNTRLGQINDWIARLENHRDALEYAEAQEDAGRVAQAQAQLQECARRLTEAEEACKAMPPREQAEWALNKLKKLKQDYLDLQMESQMIPEPQPAPEPPEVFRGMTGSEAMEAAREDAEQYRTLVKKNPAMLILGLLLCAAAAAAFVLAFVLDYLIPGLICAGVVLALAVAGLLIKRSRSKKAAALAEIYGSDAPENWIAEADAYDAALKAAQADRQRYLDTRGDLDQRLQLLREKIGRCTQGRDLEECLEDWSGAIAAWDDWADAHREHQRTENLVKTLRSMAKTARKPLLPDTLTYNEAETARLLSDAIGERQQIQGRLSQYQGRKDAVESKSELAWRLEEVNSRIRKLEDTYAALTIAQQTLTDAVMELQRRFAPRISQRAQELMGALTGGRYTRLSLGEDLALRAGAGEETLSDALWRSDGTVDQLYLALRLAVAEELSMDAPLVLDDALVRFDDDRLKAAMAILRREAEHKQVILFTCQSREKNLS